MATIFAVVAAAWLTGMLPLAVFDLCHFRPDRVTWRQRWFIQLCWPVVLILEPRGFAYFWRQVVLDTQPNIWSASYDPVAELQRKIDRLSEVHR